MPQIIAVANQKGGVGKTTTSVNLAAAFAEQGRKVLLLDLDPQGNATMGLGIDKHGIEHNGCDFLVDGVPFDQVRQKVADFTCFDVLPANGDLTAAEVALRERAFGEMVLRNLLLPIQNQYDLIFMDCPPALSLLTLNAFTASTGILVPMQCEYYALEGIVDLLQTIEKVKGAINPQLELLGVIRTMYDPRNLLANDISAQLKQHFGKKLYETVIPRNIRLAEAPSHGLPIVRYERQSRGAQAYLALAREMGL